MNKIFVLGDSHFYFFGGNEAIGGLNLLFKVKPIEIETPRQLIHNFIPLHLGSVLAYNLNHYGTKTHGREKVEFVLNAEIILEGFELFCAFGEIDLRVHVLKQAAQRNTSFQKVVEEVLINYFEFLSFLSQKNIVYVWAPIPTQKYVSSVNPKYPYFGTESERNIATEYFNERLKNLCESKGIKFFSIFRYLIDKNYKTKPGFIDDGCHLSQKAWLFALDEFKRQEINFFH